MGVRGIITRIRDLVTSEKSKRPDLSSLEVLFETAKQAVENGDYELVIAVLDVVRNRTLELLEGIREDLKAGKCLHTIGSIYRRLAATGVYTHRDRISAEILSEIEVFYVITAERGRTWDSLNPYHREFRRLLELAVDREKHDLVNEGLAVLSRSFWKHLEENVPDENDISDLWLGESREFNHLSDDQRIANNRQWTNVATGFPRAVQKVGERTVLRRNETAVSDVLSTMQFMTRRVFYADHLGDRQKRFLVKNLTEGVERVFRRSLENNLNLSSHLIPTFGESAMIRDFSYDKELERYALVHDARLLLDGLRRGLLNPTHWHPLTLVAQGLTAEAETSDSRWEALKFLGRLYSLAANVLLENPDPYEPSSVRNLAEQVGSIVTWGESSVLETDVVFEEFREAKFLLNQWLEAYGRPFETSVEWPNRDDFG